MAPNATPIVATRENGAEDQLQANDRCRSETVTATS
jgi:hypothetical protein